MGYIIGLSKGDIIEGIKGDIITVIKGDTRRLDSSPNKSLATSECPAAQG